MTESIDDVIAALVAEGSPTQVQWADKQVSQGEGAILARRDGDGIVLTQLGRVEAEDRVERFSSEAEAASALRRRLVGVPVRHRTPQKRAESASRMQQRAEEIKRRLENRESGT